MGLEMAFISDDVSNIVCIVGVHNGIMAITIKYMFINALCFGVEWTQSPYVGDQTRYARTRQS